MIKVPIMTANELNSAIKYWAVIFNKCYMACHGNLGIVGSISTGIQEVFFLIEKELPFKIVIPQPLVIMLPYSLILHGGNSSGGNIWLFSL